LKSSELRLVFASEVGDPMATVSVLALLEFHRDRQCLNNIFSHSNWDLHLASGLQEADRFLREHNPGVIITDCRFSGGEHWTDVLHLIEQLAVPPLLIVADRSPNVLAEVVNVGGYDFLAKPFDSTEVVRTVGAAWLTWKQKAEAACLTI
jgi:DNA-binding NtrC family response regulator